MAIGATERDVHRMILRQAARLGVAGAALGCCFAAMARPLVSRIAQDVSIPLPAGDRDDGFCWCWCPGRLAAGAARGPHPADARVERRVR